MDAATAQRMEQAYLERREALAQEWGAYANEHGRPMAIRMRGDLSAVRPALFEAFVLGKIAELQVLAQEESLRRQEPEATT